MISGLITTMQQSITAVQLQLVTITGGDSCSVDPCKSGELDKVDSEQNKRLKKL